MLDPIAVVIALIGSMILIFGYMEMYRQVSQKEEFKQVCRSYLLRMETYGYLTDVDRNGLIKALEDLGATNISLDGTTVSHSGITYGSIITLDVHLKMPVTSADMAGGLLDTVWNKESFDIHIKLKSTAKY